MDVVAVDFPYQRSPRRPSGLIGFPRWLPRVQARLAALCQDRKIALIHAHHPLTAAFAVRAAREHGIPLVLHLHETLPLKLDYRLLMRYCRPWLARCVCVARSAVDLAKACGLRDEQISLVYNPIADDFLGFVSTRRPSLEGAPHIGIIGTIEPRKAQHLLVEAAPAILRRHPHATFWIVGAPPFDDADGYGARLKETIEARGLGAHFRFTGFLPDIRALMGGLDLVVLTSIAYETLPSVCIEALALRRRVVASRIGSVPEIIDDGRTGFIVPPGDVPALTDAVLRALDVPDDDPMFDAGRAAIAARFSSQAYLAGLRAVYADARAPKAPPAGSPRQALAR